VSRVLADAAAGRLVVLVHDRVALPLLMSQRFTGTVTTNATRSANARAPQNSGEARPASIAPGTPSMIALSTISMTVIEMVSAASATGTAARSARPLRITGPDGERVAEQEREPDARATVCRSVHPAPCR
jgi:hypothetical protein